MNKDEALRLALEALEYPGPSWLEARQPAITAIKQALAQQEPEPVATLYEGVIAKCNLPEKFTGFLYTSPLKREPLTDAELRVIENKINPNMRWRSSDEEGITLYPQEYYELVKAIESAHGIKGEDHG